LETRVQQVRPADTDIGRHGALRGGHHCLVEVERVDPVRRASGELTGEAATPAPGIQRPAAAAGYMAEQQAVVMRVVLERHPATIATTAAGRAPAAQPPIT
jgi:hypothetical protein